jgi:hypothetical protein
LQQGEQRGQSVAQFAAVDDHVDGALLEQELGALESFRQGLAHRLLDHARTGESDQGALGSAITTSPTNAKEAETPPIVGSVSSVMKGNW